MKGVTVRKTRGGNRARGGDASFYGWLPIVLYNTFTLQPIIILCSECIVFLGWDNVSPTRQASTHTVQLFRFPFLSPLLSHSLLLNLSSSLFLPLSLSFSFSLFFRLFKQRSISYQGSRREGADGRG